MTPLIRLLLVEACPERALGFRRDAQQLAPEIELTLVDSASQCLTQLAAGVFDVLALREPPADLSAWAVLARLQATSAPVLVILVEDVNVDAQEGATKSLPAGAAGRVVIGADGTAPLWRLVRSLVFKAWRDTGRQEAQYLRARQILYIESTPMDAALTRRYFVTHAPYLKLHWIASGARALAMLLEPHPFDLVLTDLKLGDMDALAFVREATRLQYDFPVVLIAGHDEEELALTLLKQGACDYMVKRDNYRVQLPLLIAQSIQRCRLNRLLTVMSGELDSLNQMLDGEVTRRTAQLVATQSQLKATFDAMADLIWHKDLQGVVLACNSVVERLCGRVATDIVGHSDLDLFEQRVAQALGEHEQQVIRTGVTVVREHWLTFAPTNQRVLFDVACSPFFDAKGAITGVLSVGRDVTARKIAQSKLERMSQLYAALSHCNQATARCRTEEGLFKQICRDVVRFGGMKMAWIGLLEPGALQMGAVASFGRGAQGYLREVLGSGKAPQPSAEGPVGRALRTGQATWCQDFLTDASSAKWRQRPLRYGWAASAALPLFRSGRTVGSFNLYAAHAHAFDEATRGLLLDMASQISVALSEFDQRASRARIEDALRLTRISVESSSEALFWTTADGAIVDVNAAACRSLGYAREDLLALSMTAVDADIGSHAWSAHFERVRSQGALVFESRHRTKCGRLFPVEVVANFVKFGADERICAFVRDMTEHKSREARIQQLAHFDALTGLPNRALLQDRINHALGMAQRSASPLAVLLLDLDRFKRINDSLGHRIGDLLLIELARRLSAAVRDVDTAARLGGDEFLLLLPGNDAAAAAHVAKKLLAALSQPCRLEHYELVVTPSIGIAMYPVDGVDFESLSRCADAAMYRAKQEGRNDYRFFTPEMQATSARTLLLENALRDALKREQFSLHYQPQLSLATGRVIGVEALLRWQHPQIGVIPPAEFIPVAESSGQMVAIGGWVLRQALGQLKRWMDEGLAPITMAVNLSALQFYHPDLPTLVRQSLLEAQVPAHLLELELTEAVTTHNATGAIAVMNDLHDQGVSLAIDDFGTGYSSLGSLRQFKVSKLKIDPSFVQEMVLQANDRGVVLAVISLARSLGILTIAEGVETLAQRDYLHRQGCDQIQGFHVSQPLPAQRVRPFLQAH